MTYLATKKKQPGERMDYDIWYANDPNGADPWLTDSDQITGATVVVSSPELSVSHIVFADRIKLWISGGLNGKTYKVTITITTEGGRVKEDELRFRVKDI